MEDFDGTLPSSAAKKTLMSQKDPISKTKGEFVGCFIV
jgi:hypothetical protein